MSKAGFMQRPLWISAPLLWISASAITDAYTVNTFSASYLDAATELSLIHISEPTRPY